MPRRRRPRVRGTAQRAGRRPCSARSGDVQANAPDILTRRAPAPAFPGPEGPSGREVLADLRVGAGVIAAHSGGTVQDSTPASPTPSHLAELSRRGYARPRPARKGARPSSAPPGPCPRAARGRGSRAADPRPRPPAGERWDAAVANPGASTGAAAGAAPAAADPGGPPTAAAARSDNRGAAPAPPPQDGSLRTGRHGSPAHRGLAGVLVVPRAKGGLARRGARTSNSPAAATAGEA